MSTLATGAPEVLGPATDSSRSARSGGWRGLRAAVPVMLGFVPFALVLGAQASQKGFSVAEVPLMTGLNFGGRPSSRPSNCGRLHHLCC
jgi:hypothetical protein